MLTSDQKYKFGISATKTFFLIDPKSQSHFLAFTCREALHKSFTSDFKEIYFKTDDSIAFEQSCGIYAKFEEILNITEKSQIELIEKNCVKCIVSPFWLSCYMRRSLFTKLFRSCFSIPTAKKIDASDFIKQYFSTTQVGLALFLSGYTNYIGTVPDTKAATQHIAFGWDQAFGTKDVNYILLKLLSK